MKWLVRWHKTRIGFGAFALIELVLAYGFTSLAIDQGSLWWYLLALLSLIGGLHNLVSLIGKIIHGDKTAKA